MSAAAPIAERVRDLVPPALLGLLLTLLGLLGCNRGLWTPDEPREAEISREMALAPTMIPTLNGQRFIEKPPLYYWVVAAVYRLTGGASVLGARSVSVAAGLATLALLFYWGSTAHSRGAGMLCAFMLATSLQFLVSTHWVLIDPLLMLATSVAAWAAWELLARRDSLRMCLLFYLALVAALWIKGLIGPVLIGAGLIAYIGVDRPAHWRRLRPLLGIAVLGAAVALLALAILRQGGASALWEWAYVNHVQRLLNPAGSSGHRQPLPYYLWTLPYAVLPWLAPLIDALRPAHWRRAQVPGLRPAPDPSRYAALLSAAMLLVLSLAATKRETYLLPVLPLLFLWLGIRSYEWWQHWQLAGARRLGAVWWLQAGLLCLYTLLPPIAAWVWQGRAGALILGALLLTAVPAAALLYSSARQQRARAAFWAAGSAFAAAAALLALAPPLLDGTKNMGPFVRAVGQRLPPGQPVYATGVDETLAAEIPFYTARALVALDPALLRAAGARTALPEWLLMQDNHDGRGLAPPPDYDLVLSRSFGPRRSLSLWRRRASAAVP